MIRRWLTDPRLPPAIALSIAAAAFAWLIRYTMRRVPDLIAWEADHIAKAIASGHGYSFPGDRRWLWMSFNQPAGDPQQFFPTAWADPVFTYLLAGAHILFKDDVYLAVAIFNLICFAAVLWIMYRLAQRFAGPWAGVAAVVLLLANREFLRTIPEIYNTATACLLLAIATLTAVRYLEASSPKRLVMLGLALGVATLGCPIAQYFIYALVLVLIVHHWRKPREAVLRPLAMLALAALVIAPWALRNYAQFGEFVLVRNGAGQIAWLGTIGLTETFKPGIAQTAAPPPWRSEGPRDAVRKLMDDRELRIAMDHHAVDALVASPPPGYAQMNEAQRDKLYFARAKQFMREEPGITASLALSKLQVFTMKFRKYGLAVLLLAVAGALLLIRNRRSWPLSLAAAAYAAPFALAVAYFDRYRSPMEPLLAVLAGTALASLYGRLAGHGMFHEAHHRRPDPLLQRSDGDRGRGEGFRGPSA